MTSAMFGAGDVVSVGVLTQDERDPVSYQGQITGVDGYGVRVLAGQYQTDSLAWIDESPRRSVFIPWGRIQIIAAWVDE